jgi:hypothetical protein
MGRADAAFVEGDAGAGHDVVLISVHGAGLK